MNVRVADADDAEVISGLLHDFNTEYNEPAPSPSELAARLRQLLAEDTDVLLMDGVGLALLRFRRSLWTPGLECYLAEFYVRPEHRGRGLGRALLGAAIDHARKRGADHMDLGTSEDDEAARHLYGKAGFRRREGDGGPLMFVYEREL